MNKHLLIIFFAFQFVFSGIAILQAQKNMVFEEVDGLVAVEAEHFSMQKKTEPSSGQRLQWCQGKHSWRWESAQRTNEVHCGVPGLIYLDVPSKGIHTIAFSMREDGFRFDKWMMTNDPDFERPEDAGPAERIFSGTTNIIPVTGSYFYKANEDFEDITSGVVPYYKDKNRNALAINAAREWKRDKFAGAATTFFGNHNVYDIQLTTLAEFDGECTYRILVNDKVVGTFINTSVHVEDDYKPIMALFRNIRLSANDKITVESNTHTNGLIPEGDGTAWARGRWTELACIPSSERSVVRAFPGRVAWSADGNQHDTDDWLASPWALAIFRAAGLSQRKVVYFGYNSHLWATTEGYDEIHENNIKGSVERWGGYNDAILFNEVADTDAAVEKLVEEINRSTASDPLWLVAAGPIETFGMAIEKAHADALRHVTLLSHSTWNTNHAFREHNSKYSLEYLREIGVNYKKIKDQNNQDGMPGWTAQGLKRKTEYFEFLKDHVDERLQWLWHCRVMPMYENPHYQKGFYDYSDAGMAYWLITGANDGGDEEASPQKTFDLLDRFISGN